MGPLQELFKCPSPVMRIFWVLLPWSAKTVIINNIFLQRKKNANKNKITRIENPSREYWKKHLEKRGSNKIRARMFKVCFRKWRVCLRTDNNIKKQNFVFIDVKRLDALIDEMATNLIETGKPQFIKNIPAIVSSCINSEE